MNLPHGLLSAALPILDDQHGFAHLAASPASTSVTAQQGRATQGQQHPAPGGIARSITLEDRQQNPRTAAPREAQPGLQKMRTVHRLSPLKEEACGWRPGAAKPVVAPPPAGNREKLQTQTSLRGDASDPTPLLFALEDIPSPLQRPPPTAAAASAGGLPGPQCQSTIETLQLLLGPASQAEEMVSLVQFAFEGYGEARRLVAC